MYLLDSNILSEMMKSIDRQHPNFYTWAKEQHREQLFISSFTLSEIYQGIYRLPQGKRRAALYQALKHVERIFANTLLTFDTMSAEYFGIVRERSASLGLSMDVADSYFLAVAERYAMTLVTRNTKHFIGCTHLAILNPFDSSATM